MSQLAWFGNTLFEADVSWWPVPSPRGHWWT